MDLKGKYGFEMLKIFSLTWGLFHVYKLRVDLSTIGMVPASELWYVLELRLSNHINGVGWTGQLGLLDLVTVFGVRTHYILKCVVSMLLGREVCCFVHLGCGGTGKLLQKTEVESQSFTATMVDIEILRIGGYTAFIIENA